MQLTNEQTEIMEFCLGVEPQEDGTKQEVDEDTLAIWQEYFTKIPDATKAEAYNFHLIMSLQSSITPYLRQHHEAIGEIIQTINRIDAAQVQMMSSRLGGDIRA